MRLFMRLNLLFALVFCLPISAIATTAQETIESSLSHVKELNRTARWQEAAIHAARLIRELEELGDGESLTMADVIDEFGEAVILGYGETYPARFLCDRSDRESGPVEGLDLQHLLRLAVDIRRTNESARLVSSLLNLGEYLFRDRRTVREASELFAEALELTDSEPPSLNRARALFMAGKCIQWGFGVYRGQADPLKARQMYLESLDIFTRLGLKTRVPLVLLQLGVTAIYRYTQADSPFLAKGVPLESLLGKQDYGLGLRYFAQALSVAEDVNPRSSMVGTVLSYMGEFHFDELEDPAFGRSFFRTAARHFESIGLWEEAFHAYSYWSLMEVRYELDPSFRIEPDHEAERILESRGETDSLQLHLNEEMSRTAESSGDVASAFYRWHESLRLLKAFGPEPDANFFQRGAKLAYAVGELGEAIELSEASRKLRQVDFDLVSDLEEKKAFARGIWIDLNNIGWYLMGAARYDAARKAFEEAIIWSDRAGDFPQTALTNFAVVLAKLGHSGKALELYRKIDERTAAEPRLASNPEYTLLRLAELQHDQGTLAEAETDFLKALKVGRETSPNLLRSYSHHLLEIGRVDDAFAMARELETLSSERVRLALQTLPEQQALNVARESPSGLDLLVAVALRKPSRETAEAAWNSIIASRARVFDELSERRRNRLQSQESEGLRRELNKARSDLATLILSSDRGQASDDYLTQVDQARKKKEQLEWQLARLVNGPDAHPESENASLESLTRELPPGTALLSFVQFDAMDLDRRKRGHEHSQPDLQYAAFVIRPGSDPVAVLLGSASEIDAVVAAWGREASRPFSPDSSAGKVQEESYRRASKQLYKRIWQPIIGPLGETNSVFLVPAGKLSLINFYTLLSPSDQYLVEAGPLIHYLSTERNLRSSPARKTNSGLFVLGGPTFDVGASPKGLAPEAIDSTRPAMFRVPNCGPERPLHFAPIPGTDAEVSQLGELWNRVSSRGQMTALTGSRATEDAVKRNAGEFGILHFATHGFFLSPRCVVAESVPTRGVGRVVKADQSDKIDELSKKEDRQVTAEKERVETNGSEAFDAKPLISPMLRAGLALAGANSARDARPGSEDGILTAEELVGLNWEGVQLAFLSACETGAGELDTTEGVLGLRRAVEIAGARNVVTSLWSLADTGAVEWTRSFYRAFLQDELSPAQAAQKASLALLKRQRDDGRGSHPFHWGAFVAYERR